MADNGTASGRAGWSAFNEQERLAALADLQVIEGGPDPLYERIARIGRAALRFPRAHVSLITQDRQILKTSSNYPGNETSREASVCNLAIRGDVPLIIPDMKLDGRTDCMSVVTVEGARAYWGAPLTTRHGHNLGAFCLLDTVPRYPQEPDIAILRDLARLTIECMELRSQASTDVLTGVQSRRSLLAEGAELFDSLGEGESMSCILLDIDNFKLINDNHGHAKGDDVLRDVAGLLHGALREGTPFGRIGGEEFVILLPGENLAGAHAVAERLRRLLVGDKIAGLPVTASFGVAERIAGDGSLQDMLDRADRHTYEAKRAGRNSTRPALQGLA